MLAVLQPTNLYLIALLAGPVLMANGVTGSNTVADSQWCRHGPPSCTGCHSIRQPHHKEGDIGGLRRRLQSLHRLRLDGPRVVARIRI